MRHESVELQLGVLRKNPPEQLTRKMLEPALEQAQKIVGLVGLQIPAPVVPVGDGSSNTAAEQSVCFVVNFPSDVKLRMEHWNTRNYLVVGSNIHSTDMTTGQKKVNNKMVAFNLSQLKEPNGNLPLECAGVFENLKFQLIRATLDTSKVTIS